MLKRLYIDNYKCFVNFEFKPDKLNLLLGENGTGKSAIGEVLWALRSAIIDQTPVAQVEAFWEWNVRMKSPSQAYGIELELGDERFDYRLMTDRDNQGNLIVSSETLSVNTELIFESKAGQVRLGTSRPEVTYGKERTGVHASTADERGRRFVEWFQNFRYVRVNPAFGFDEGPVPVPRDSDPPLAPFWQNFPQWIRLMKERDLEGFVLARDWLRTCMPPFAELIADRSTRWLHAEFGTPDESYQLPLVKLSDGQKVLIVLHCLLADHRRRSGLLIIDEPDNFVSLREIQPWLSLLEETVESGPAQCFVISHHPEILNQLVDRAIVFQRRPSGWIAAEPLDRENALSLPLSELVASGWLK